MIDIFKIANDAQKSERKIKKNWLLEIFDFYKSDDILNMVVILYLVPLFVTTPLMLFINNPINIFLISSATIIPPTLFLVNFNYDAYSDKKLFKHFNGILKEWSNQTFNDKYVLFKQLALLQNIIDKEQETQINLIINELIKNNVQLKHLGEIDFVHSFLSKENLYYKLTDDSMYSHFLNFGKMFYYEKDYLKFQETVEEVKAEKDNQLQKQQEEYTKQLEKDKHESMINRLEFINKKAQEVIDMTK